MSEEEKTTLEDGYKNHSKAHFRNRCKSILMSNSGYKVSEIARFFEVRTRTIYTWFNEWEKNGIDGLTISPGRGVKAALDINNDIHYKIITEALEEDCQDLNHVCDKVKEHLGFSVSKRVVRSFLKKKILLEKVQEKAT
ncbi:MAG: helix-turn-helix domain-containing protein [Alphaproteobacteria bacterium]|nr:helix-turn-helix domain-containing protein [Alphaproteobacteria bacterium]